VGRGDEAGGELTSISSPLFNELGRARRIPLPSLVDEPWSKSWTPEALPSRWRQTLKNRGEGCSFFGGKLTSSTGVSSVSRRPSRCTGGAGLLIELLGVGMG